VSGLLKSIVKQYKFMGLGNRLSLAKTTEAIEMPFGRQTHVVPRNHVLYEVVQQFGQTIDVHVPSIYHHVIVSAVGTVVHR